LGSLKLLRNHRHSRRFSLQEIPLRRHFALQGDHLLFAIILLQLFLVNLLHSPAGDDPGGRERLGHVFAVDSDHVDMDGFGAFQTVRKEQIRKRGQDLKAECIDHEVYGGIDGKEALDLTVDPRRRHDERLVRYRQLLQNAVGQRINDRYVGQAELLYIFLHRVAVTAVVFDGDDAALGGDDRGFDGDALAGDDADIVLISGIDLVHYDGPDFPARVMDGTVGKAAVLDADLVIRLGMGIEDQHSG
jgi:hypothetical protein